MYRLLALVVLLVLSPPAPGQLRDTWRDFHHGVDDLAFSPDGKMLATCSRPADGGKDALRVWDVATGKELFRLGDYKYSHRAPAFSPDGKSVVTSGTPAPSIDVWDLASRKVRLNIKLKPGVGGIAVSPDSKLLAAGGRFWDMRTGEERGVWEEGRGRRILSLAFSPDGKTLAATVWPRAVVLWDAPSGKERALLDRHKSHIGSAAFSPDGKTLYSVGHDLLIVYWDVATGKERKVVDLRRQGLPFLPRKMALSPDGKVMAILGNGRIRLFYVEEAKLREDVEWEYLGDGRCIAYAPRGEIVATGHGGNPRFSTVCLWNVPLPPKKVKD